MTSSHARPLLPTGPSKRSLPHWRGLLGVLLALLMIAAPLAAPASARMDYVRETPPANALYGPNTDIVISRLGNGQALTGALPPAGTTWPVTTYPTTIPAGYETDNPSFAGVIITEDINGTTTAPMYCIDIRTETRVGIGYENGTWDEATVPNIGYVERILNSYYPTVPNQPAGLNNNQRAAAVQAAIWFFSDGFVVNPGNPLYSAVQAIVNATIAAGPLPQPAEPDITITPAVAEGPVDGVTGPYTVAAEDAATVTVSVPRGYSLYADAAGTQPLDNPVASGTQVWVRSDTGSTAPATITARGVVTVPTGNVYLYDGTNPDVTTAQKLILAATRDLSSTATATAEFFAVGSLTVTKTILGEAAGSQEAVTINIDCGTGYQFTLEVPAASITGASQTFDGIPAGNTCTVTEPVTGGTSTVLVVPSLPQPVTIAAGTTALATVADTYTFAPGVLVVEKLFTGEAAGNQGVVVLQVVCGTALNTTVTIPAGQTTPFTQEFPGVPAGTVCTVTEPTTGSTTEVTATPTLPADVTIPVADSVTSTVSNEYTFNPGVIAVNKVIAGPAAGQQGDVVLSLTCTGTPAVSELISIPAGTTGTFREEFEGVPAGATCTVVETTTGETTAIGVVTESTGPVTIPAGDGAEITVTDTYSLNPGSLTVSKALAGPAAGEQGEVTLQVTCTSGETVVFTDTVVLPAGSVTGTSETFDDIPANAECDVTEPATGETATVAVVVALPDTVTVPAGGTATATVTNTYTLKPGTLRLLKTIDGEAAGLQEAITIVVSCGPDGSVLEETWNIPAGVTGTGDAQFRNIPAGTECTVTETNAGTTGAISVVTTVEPDPVTIPAGAVAEVGVTNTYSLNPGTLAVRKFFAGEAAGSQGDVELLVTCIDDDGGTVLDESVPVPPGETESFETTFEDLPPGAECTVTEPVSGATETVAVQTDLPDPVVIPAGDGAEAVVTNTYTFAAGLVSLTKTVAGTAVGEQGEIRLNIVCRSGDIEVLNETVSLPAETVESGNWVFGPIVAGAGCAVTEPFSGANDEVEVSTELPPAVTVAASGTVSLTVVNTYTAVTGPAPAPAPVVRPAYKKTKALPATGSDGIVAVVWAGAGALVLGGLLVLAAKRRRSGEAG